MKLVYGLGRSGRAVLRHLARRGAAMQWWDDRPSPQDLQLVGELEVERADLSRGVPGRFAQVIAAPGVPIDHPDLLGLRAAGTEVIGEAELGYRDSDLPMIAVTGTAGKGSTVAAIAALLRAQGIRAEECGNFDPPLLSVLDSEAPPELAVVELSSFQLERVDRFRSQVAVITNLGVDHLDRHGTVARYHDLKRRIYRNQRAGDWTIVPASELERARSGSLGRCLGVPAHLEQLLDLQGRPVMGSEELPGGVFPENAQAALWAAQAWLQRPAASWHSALQLLQPLPGRFERVGQLGGVDFVDDTLATRSLSALQALRRAKAPVAWILGGIDKGADLDVLRSAVMERVCHIVAIGRDGPRLASAFPLPSTRVAAELGSAAMDAAVRAALAALPGAGSVLLAPLAASFDLFQDYKDRSREFRRAVSRLLLERAERA